LTFSLHFVGARAAAGFDGQSAHGCAFSKKGKDARFLRVLQNQGGVG